MIWGRSAEHRPAAYGSSTDGCRAETTRSTRLLAGLSARASAASWVAIEDGGAGAPVARGSRCLRSSPMARRRWRGESNACSATPPKAPRGLLTQAALHATLQAIDQTWPHSGDDAHPKRVPRHHTSCDCRDGLPEQRSRLASTPNRYAARYGRKDAKSRTIGMRAAARSGGSIPFSRDRRDAPADFAGFHEALD